MAKLLIPAVALVGLAACSTQQLASTQGQLFCDLITQGGGSAVVQLIDAEASAAGAGPVAVIATNMGADFVYSKCAAAAAATGSVAGMPVSPPVNPAAAPVVAVK